MIIHDVQCIIHHHESSQVNTPLLGKPVGSCSLSERNEESNGLGGGFLEFFLFIL